ncbi:MAG TPA: cytochrome c3 family protein [Chloroflexota bacterium]|jgi:hypothetical protein|nr:cytochrome c3 family protein [Chloroflexota bacterium]
MNRSLAFVAPLLALVIPGTAIAAGIFYITTIAPFLIGGQPLKPPAEPLLFDHSIHTRVAGIECVFCHRSAAKGFSAGYPDVEQCMFCHSVVGAGQPEIEKVRTAWINQQPITWERIHRLPDHVHFVHEAHIKAGFDCATCHGDVRQMSQVVQARRLNMGDCVDCHRQYNAPTECVACHY